MFNLNVLQKVDGRFFRKNSGSVVWVVIPVVANLHRWNDEACPEVHEPGVDAQSEIYEICWPFDFEVFDCAIGSRKTIKIDGAAFVDPLIGVDAFFAADAVRSPVSCSSTYAHPAPSFAWPSLSQTRAEIPASGNGVLVVTMLKSGGDMAYWRKLKSRFEYEVAIGNSEADRDRVLDIVKQIDPDAWWVRVDGQYVICSNQLPSVRCL
ncbi:hypothetical protein [Rhizobium leguminosarum]